jgi:hypothetical protein
LRISNREKTLGDKINTVILTRPQNIAKRYKLALLVEMAHFDPISLDAKREVIQSVSTLLESTKRLKISFNEFFPTR